MMAYIKRRIHSLYFFMILILLVMALLPLLSMSAVGYSFFSRFVLDTVAQSNIKTLDQVEYKLTQIRMNINDILVKISGHATIQDILQQSGTDDWTTYRNTRFFSEFANLLMSGNDEIYRIAIVDLQGRSYDSLGRSLPNDQISEPEVFRVMLERLLAGETSTAVSGIYENHNGVQLISFGKLVLNLHTGRPLGMVVADLNLRLLRNELAQVSLLNSGKVMLVDEDDRVIFHPSLAAGSRLDMGDIAGDASRFFVQDPESGELYLYLRSSLGDSSWRLYGIIPYEEVLDQTKSIQGPFIIAVIVILGVILVLAYTLQRVYVRPVRVLQKLMRRVQEGEFSIRAHFRRKDEIGQLAGSFNEMVDRINALIREVYEVKLNESKALLYQKQAELDMLQTRMTPHFLYNTLNSISWFAQRRGVREIQAVVDSLSRMLQYNLAQSSRFVTLREEFEYLRLFADIIDFRYQGDIRFRYDLPPELQHVRLPRFTIQPLVENAVKHGVDETAGKHGYRVNVAAKLDGADVVITVMDNGKGMTEEQLRELRQKLDSRDTSTDGDAAARYEGGMGLFNVHRRLQLWFGEEYGLRICSQPGEGTTITMNIPFDSTRQ